MDAGYELDVLVAEKVLGWEHRPPAITNPRSQKQWYRPDQLSHPVTLPAFSTDIAAAWQVAEKLRLAVEPWSDTGWLAWQPPAEGWYCPALTAPLAICLAALTAVGVEP